MRIPVYRSQIQATNEAPGRAFQTRKNAQPFVQAALDKDAAGRALTSSIGDYALYRYNMSEQLKLDEASVKAQDQLRNLAFDLARDDDPANVLDGANKWKSQSNQIKKNILASLGTNKNTLQKFNSTFMTSESNNRFALRNDLNEVIKTRKETISSAYFTQHEETLINNFSIKNYRDVIKEIRDYHAPKIKNKDIEQSVLDEKIRAMQINIANGVLAKVVANDPYIASKFTEKVDLIDKAAKATQVLDSMTKEEIVKTLGQETYNYYVAVEMEGYRAARDIAKAIFASTGEESYSEVEYAFHALGQLREDNIQDSTFKILKEANDYRQQLREAEEAHLKKDAFYEEYAYEQFFAIKDGQTYDENAVESMLPQSTIPRSYGADALRKAFQGKDTLSADELRALMMDVIVTNGTSPEKQKTMMEWPPESSEDGSGSDDSSAQTKKYFELMALIENPNKGERPTIEQILQHGANNELTEPLAQKLITQLRNLKDEAFSSTIRIAKDLFRFKEGIAATEGLAKVQEDGYFRVTGLLREWYQEQINTEGKPRASEIDAKYKELLGSYSQTIILEAKKQLVSTIDTFNKVGLLAGPNNIYLLPTSVETIAEMDAVLNMVAERLKNAPDDDATTTAATHKIILEAQIEFIKDLMQGN